MMESELTDELKTTIVRTNAKIDSLAARQESELAAFGDLVLDLLRESAPPPVSLDDFIKGDQPTSASAPAKTFSPSEYRAESKNPDLPPAVRRFFKQQANGADPLAERAHAQKMLDGLTAKFPALAAGAMPTNLEQAKIVDSIAQLRRIVHVPRTDKSAVDITRRLRGVSGKERRKLRRLIREGTRIALAAKTADAS